MGSSITFIAMIMVILAQVTDMLISKVAFSNGMNKYVFVVYSCAISTIVFLPCSLISHRPPLTLSILFRIFLLSVIGVLIRTFFSIGISYSSPMLGTAMLNLIPAVTFILAVIFRMEKLDWRIRGGQAKLLGTVLSIAGAFIVTFYYGIPILKLSSRTVSSPFQQLVFTQKSNWILGGFFLAAGSILISVFYIFQTSVIRKFPAIFIITFCNFFFRTILSGLNAFFVVEDPAAWRLRLDSGLFAVLYSGIVVAIFELSLCMWCLWKAGPLYVSMFKPLAIVLAVALDFIFLGEPLGLGSLIGAIVIISGFYTVMWGKAKEGIVTDDAELGGSGLSDDRVPLLPSKIGETIK